MNSCLFCRIVNKEIPSKIVYEDEEILAFQDINPQAPVHVLIIPRKHISCVMSLTSEDSLLLGRIFQAAQKIARTGNVHEAGFRLVVNSGPDAGQAVDHLHYHLLGGRRFGWPPG